MSTMLGLFEKLCNTESRPELTWAKPGGRTPNETIRVCLGVPLFAVATTCVDTYPHNGRSVETSEMLSDRLKNHEVDNS